MVILNRIELYACMAPVVISVSLSSEPVLTSTHHCGAHGQGDIRVTTVYVPQV